LPLLLALSPSEIVALTSVGLYRQVLGFSLVVTLLTAILFGLAPAFFAARSDPSASLREGARGSSFNTTSARSILIAIEIALSLVLLVGAGLMMKSFIKLTAVDPGFDPDRLLVFNLGLPASASHEQQTSFYQEVVKELTALPGIESVGAVSRLPLAGGNSSRSFNIPGSGQTYNADVRVSTPEYFRTMKIPLLKGRNFNDHDRADSPPVAIINQATAASVFPGQDPIGKYLTNFGPEDSKLQVVGVVGNVRHLALESAARPEIYVPVRQEQWPSMFVTLRSAVAKPLNLLPSVQETVWRIDRNIPLANPRTMEDVLAHSLLRRKFAMLLLSIFAGLATSLAAIGLYGVISFSVAQRTKEIGIRMALGGQRGDVLRMVLRQSSVLVLSGLLLGVPVALAVARLLGWMLYGVGSADLLIYSSVVLLLALAALAASIVPALRATQVDPMVALRYE
jgi:putative ABC transport system permease protein